MSSFLHNLTFKFDFDLSNLYNNLRGVDMNLSDYKDSIIIIKSRAKSNFLKKLSKEKRLLNIKLFTLEELKKNFFFSYAPQTLDYVVKKYKVIPEIGEIYLDNLYYIDENICDEKMENLKKIYADLKEQDLIVYNDLFKEFLKNKKVVLYNLGQLDKFYEKMFNNISKISKLNIIEEKKETSIKPLYRCIDKEEEAAFVASQVSDLLKNGVDINKIKLANVQKDYYFTLKKTFKFFNIPLELPTFDTVKGTELVKKFKQLFNNDIESTFENLKEYVKNKKDEILYNDILKIVNNYSWSKTKEDVKYLIFRDIDHLPVQTTIFKNAVRAISFEDDFIEDDEYIYLINFNQGSIPKTYKDEDYLSDSIKEKLNLSTSTDLNVKSTYNVQKRIGEIKNLVVTCAKRDLSGELYISSAYEPQLLEEKEVYISYEHSNNYNKMRLVCAKDENKKFGTVTKELTTLLNHYSKENYCGYDNRFKGLNEGKLNNYLNGKLTLSYSSMNEYYNCSFKYYLKKILKVDKFNDTFASIIGSIFHNILSECFTNNYEFEEAWKKNIDNVDYEFNDMEKFFLENLKEELILIIDTIKNQMEYTNLKDACYEKEIVVKIDNNVNIIFKGFIDKIIYNKDEERCIVAIIDYKTGDPDLNIENSVYGLGMQLPVYIYLLKNSNDFKNAKIGGFYLQKILNTSNDIEKRKESLKLQGYTNSNLEILSQVDNTYTDSKIIKSLKMTSNGLSAYSKVISDEQIENLSEIVDSKIKEASKNILSGNFEINPKQLGDKLVGCNFCKFKDICYRTNSDIVKLAKVDRKTFLGGDKSANMDD